MFEFIKKIRRIKGAGYTEVMLILSLISVAGMVSFKSFGNHAQKQVAGLSYEISGQTYNPEPVSNDEILAQSISNSPNSYRALGASISTGNVAHTDASQNTHSISLAIAQTQSSEISTTDFDSSIDLNSSSTTTSGSQSSSFQNSTVQDEVEEEKSLAVQILENIGEFSAGFAEGVLEQAQDLLDVVLHPIDTASSMIDLVKMLKDNPEAVVQAMLEELGADAKKLISGDMREVGQVVGKYISPAMALKIVTKAKAIAKIAKKADSKDSPTPSCCCFAKGTPVSTPDGFKAIDQLKVGDLVQSKSELTGELQSKPVSELFLNLSSTTDDH